MDVRDIPIGELLPPRRVIRLAADDERMAHLHRSIVRDGMLQAIIVTPEDGRYRIVAGHRRYLICKGLGHKVMSCSVRDLTPLEQETVSLAENLAREDLNPVDLGHRFLGMMSEHGLLQKDIGELVGRSQQWVSERVQLARLPEDLQEHIQEQRLPWRGALQLQRVDNPRLREAYTRDAVVREQSPSQIKAVADAYVANKENVDQGVAVAQEEREFIRLHQEPTACFGCGRLVGEFPADMRWLCTGCQHAIIEAQQREAQQQG